MGVRDILRLAVEVYRRETEKVIKRFLAQTLSFPECISALEAALDDLVPRLRVEQRASLRDLILANNEIVTKEMERRGPP